MPRRSKKKLHRAVGLTLVVAAGLMLLEASGIPVARRVVFTIWPIIFGLIGGIVLQTEIQYRQWIGYGLITLGAILLLAKLNLPLYIVVPVLLLVLGLWLLELRPSRKRRASKRRK